MLSPRLLRLTSESNGYWKRVQTRGGIAWCFDKGAERTSAFGTQSISPPRVGAANANRAKVTAIMASMVVTKTNGSRDAAKPQKRLSYAQPPKFSRVVSCCQKPKLVRDGVRPRLKSNGYWKAMQIYESRPGILVSDFWFYRFPLPPHLCQARVQGIAQRVAEEIEAHQGKENEKPRQENLQRSDENVGRGVGKKIAPAWCRWLDSEA
jgi:hypothetical protein